MTAPLRKPAWLKRPLNPPGQSRAVGQTLEGLGLSTVCRSARCPNRGQCFGQGTATFLLLGPCCTRSCAFCAVDKGPPAPPDPDEPKRIARAVKSLGLGYSVLTMVTRDDLPDGGAAQVAAAIRAIGHETPGAKVEVLISDLGGDPAALDAVLRAKPQVLNHNLETVPRLYKAVRPQARYERSLELIRRAGERGAVTKSGLMLGLGEEPAEVDGVLRDLRAAGCVLLTLGQYLSPGPEHHPVARYLEPGEWDQWADRAKELGFAGVASGAYVRSSFEAAGLYEKALGAA